MWWIHWIKKRGINIPRSSSCNKVLTRRIHKSVLRIAKTDRLIKKSTKGIARVNYRIKIDS
jgi:hypothetical protein